MKAYRALLIAGTLLSLTFHASSQPVGPQREHDQERRLRSGKFLFESETFGGNGRTCATCHGKETGKFSIEEAQRRFATDPTDPLFRAIDSDDGDGASYSRLLTTGTVRVDVPLASNVTLVADPTATHVTLFRSTPTVKNVTTLQQFLMFDGRESSADLPRQALGAVHQHTENQIEPTAEQLERIADFQRTDPRFFQFVGDPAAFVPITDQDKADIVAYMKLL